MSNAGSSMEVFLAFLKLGLTSFGGPIAHLGIFRREFVERRRWLGEGDYAQLLALCQSLPGPASTQLGFALGMLRAGGRGAIAAFIAFTTPSVVLMLALAWLLPALHSPTGLALVHGLKLFAVAVVAQGLLGMIRTLTPDWPRRAIAAAAVIVIVATGSWSFQALVIVTGAAIGLLMLRTTPGLVPLTLAPNYGRTAGTVCLLIFAVLLAAAVWASGASAPLAAVAAAFYRVGALVFGGGHVVLPLLDEAIVAPGWIERDVFLVGYGAAQAMPGPMFSVAAFLGAQLQMQYGGAGGALVAVAAIFLPGLLLVAGALPWWHALAKRPAAAAALAGINASVVGLLAAALYDPLWTGAIHAPADLVIAAIGFVMLAVPRVPLLAALITCLAAAVIVAP